MDKRDLSVNGRLICIVETVSERAKVTNGKCGTYSRQSPHRRSDAVGGPEHDHATTTPRSPRPQAAAASAGGTRCTSRRCAPAQRRITSPGAPRGSAGTRRWERCVRDAFGWRRRHCVELRLVWVLTDEGQVLGRGCSRLDWARGRNGRNARGAGQEPSWTLRGLVRA